MFFACLFIRMQTTDMATLLLIDDDDLVRFSLNELLTDAGHQVVEMSSGLGCEKYLETQLIDCVITDIVMPDKDGIEVLLSVKQTFPHMPVIVLSGGGRISGGEYLVMADALGADAVVDKPVMPDVLLETVLRVLD